MTSSTRRTISRFLYIDPIKQGLKRSNIEDEIKYENLFLYIDPIKQGLKQSRWGYDMIVITRFYT